MISESALDLFDALQWLGTAENVAERYPTTQPTISRTARRCAKVFEAEITRSKGEYSVHTNSELLLRTRRVHQMARWDNNKPLRIDAYHYYYSIYFHQWIPGLICGTFDLLHAGRIAGLIRESIVDCWIATAPDVPAEDPEIACIPLAESPLFLFALANHTLFQRNRELGLATELRDLPVLTYGRHLMPKTHDLLSQQFSSALESIGRDRFSMAAIIKTLERHPNCFIAATESDFATAPRASSLDTQPLNIQLPFALRHCLLVRRQYARHPRLLELLATLKARARHAAALYPSIRPL